MGSVTNLISIVDADPELGELLDAPERERARREALTRVNRLSTGSWDAASAVEPDVHHRGFLVIEGLLSPRSNPYPAPDTENDIPHRGLRAYDCRNVGNPLILPPTGSGSSPCRLQGPWSFNGKSAYYPRLQEAPQ